jgi:hypothetical protein
MSLTGGIRPYDTFSFFELNCRAVRETHLWRTLSQTCDRCGITYAAHFDHPQRCPSWKTDEVDRQAAQEPALIW